ncbi:MAG TPA: hypothetical protein VNO30_49415 [Kofleriaceae bacterium]|nr:hypothetical protein [Kofleriaceae bacterium]
MPGTPGVTEALRRLAPAAATAEDAYLSVFRDIAALLLDRATLYVAGQPHRLTELELYWNGLLHRDPFTHGDPMQQQLGAWYFHRSGGRYRGGTYKGLDIAFGSSEAFGGILLRGLERVDRAPDPAPPAPDPAPPAPAASLIDGPCMVVDHILQLTASPSIEALVSRFDGMIERRDLASPLASLLYIDLDAGPGRGAPIYATPRIGLTLKKGSTEARRRYLARPYRFLSEPARIRKGKPYLVTALHLEGRSPDEIAALTGTRRAVVDGYLAAFAAGRARGAHGIEDPGGDLSTEGLCRLLGACAAAGA